MNNLDSLNMKNIWDNYPEAITICDKNYQIMYMNSKSMKVFEKDGGADLLGKSLLDCHQPKSIEIMKRIFETGIPNTYTIEKNGQKKLIHQAPWYSNSEISGIIELSIILPEKMEHYIRT